MDHTRGNIIIIEGAQGVGKSSLASYLRDNLESSNLYRLSGIKDKTFTGYEKNKKMYLGLIRYLKTLEDTELNLIFDRMFFSEQVYSILGYKEYEFEKAYNKLLKKLNDLNFNIYVVVLYLNDTSLYQVRLRRMHHQYQTFSLENSINQQDEYLKLLDNMKCKNIIKLKIAVDDFEDGYNNLIDSISVLKESGIKYKR